MAGKNLMGVLFGILVIATWVLGSTIEARAETMNYKYYTWVIKSESVPISDMEGHAVGFVMRGGFFVFENGEVATANQVATIDYIKGAGPFMSYVTINFADGSTIIIKNQGTMAGASTGSPSLVAWTSEITKGTGRFEGFKLKAINPRFSPLKKGKSSPKHTMKVRSPIPFLPNDICRLYNAFGRQGQRWFCLPCEHFLPESSSFINMRA